MYYHHIPCNYNWTKMDCIFYTFVYNLNYLHTCLCETYIFLQYANFWEAMVAVVAVVAAAARTRTKRSKRKRRRETRKQVKFTVVEKMDAMDLFVYRHQPTHHLLLYFPFSFQHSCFLIHFLPVTTSGM